MWGRPQAGKVPGLNSRRSFLGLLHGSRTAGPTWWLSVRSTREPGGGPLNSTGWSQGRPPTCLWPDSGLRRGFVGDNPLIVTRTWALCNIGYPSETHLKLKSHKNSFVHNIRFSCRIVLKIYTTHNCDTTVLHTKLRNGLLWNMLWENEISRDLGESCFSDGYPILHNAQSNFIYETCAMNEGHHRKWANGTYLRNDNETNTYESVVTPQGN